MVETFGVVHEGVISLSLLSTMIAACTLGLAYAFGQLLQNPRFSVWAKEEVGQLVITILVVLLSLSMLTWISGMDYNLLKGVSGESLTEADYAHPQISGNLFEVSEKYLQNIAYLNHVDVRASRTLYGAYDENIKYTRSPCMPSLLLCLLGQNGYNFLPQSGESSWQQVANLTMYAGTASYLTTLAQLFFLRFIQDGLIWMYFPFAILLRSLPFMRPLGGALLALAISLMIFYPIMVFIEAFFWNPYAMFAAVSDSDAFGSMEDFADSEPDPTDDGGKLLDISMLSIRLSSVSFLCSTFLFTFNIVAVSALAQGMAVLLGGEVDLGKLMHII